MNMTKQHHLTDRQKKKLQTLGHTLKPVILIGDKGVSENLIAECDRALEHHELVKVKARGRDLASRKSIFKALCEATGAEAIQSVGMTALIFRPNSVQPRIDLSES